MFIQLDKSGPVYQQVYHALRQAILEGVLTAGQKMPSTRLLSSENSVSRNTVVMAYDQLIAEGYVETRVGAGTFVAANIPAQRITAKPNAIVRKAGGLNPRLSGYGRRVLANYAGARSASDQKLDVDFRYGAINPDDFPLDIWRRIVLRKLKRSQVDWLQYSDPAGFKPLRTAICNHIKQHRAIDTASNRIVIVNGSQQAFDILGRILLNDGDAAAIEEPGYAGARRSLEATGAKIEYIPLDEGGIDIEKLAQCAHTPKLVYVTPSHQFPTGSIMKLSQRLAILEWAAKSKAYLIEDDYDSEFHFDNRPIEAIHALDAGNSVIYVGTFSKTLFPALRLGYVVLPEQLVQPFLAARSLIDRHSPTIMQEVLADFISDGHYERHVWKIRTKLSKRRATLMRELRTALGSDVILEGANAGLHSLVWFPGLKPAAASEIITEVSRAGVGVYPIEPYFRKGPPFAGLLLGYGSVEERKISKGVAVIADIVRKMHMPRRKAS